MTTAILSPAILNLYAGQLAGMAEVLRAAGHIAEAIEAEILARRIDQILNERKP